MMFHLAPEEAQGIQSIPQVIYFDFLLQIQSSSDLLSK